MKPSTSLPCMAALSVAMSDWIASCPTYCTGPVHTRTCCGLSRSGEPGVANPGRTGPPEPEYHRPDAYKPGKSHRSRPPVPACFGGLLGSGRLHLNAGEALVDVACIATGLHVFAVVDDVHAAGDLPLDNLG